MGGHGIIQHFSTYVLAWLSIKSIIENYWSNRTFFSVLFQLWFFLYIIYERCCSRSYNHFCYLMRFFSPLIFRCDFLLFINWKVLSILVNFKGKSLKRIRRKCYLLIPSRWINETTKITFNSLLSSNFKHQSNFLYQRWSITQLNCYTQKKLKLT